MMSTGHTYMQWTMDMDMDMCMYMQMSHERQKASL